MTFQGGVTLLCSTKIASCCCILINRKLASLPMCVSDSFGCSYLAGKWRATKAAARHAGRASSNAAAHAEWLPRTTSWTGSYQAYCPDAAPAIAWPFSAILRRQGKRSHCRSCVTRGLVVAGLHQRHAAQAWSCFQNLWSCEVHRPADDARILAILICNHSCGKRI